MTCILVVEDDAEKLRRVTTCLMAVDGVQRDMIFDARDVNSAKRLMRDRQFDLLVLDISIPNWVGELPNHDSGLELLQEVLGRDIYNAPTHIVGLTAYEAALHLAQPHF